MTTRSRSAEERRLTPERPAVLSRWHLHRYRRTGPDDFGTGSLYACRCGVVRPGF